MIVTLLVLLNKKSCVFLLCNQGVPVVIFNSVCIVLWACFIITKYTLQIHGEVFAS